MGKIEDELTSEEQQAFDKIFNEVLNDMVECGMITKTTQNGTDYYSFQPSEEKDEVKIKFQKLLEKYEEALFFAHTHIENLNKIIVKQKELIKVLQEKNKIAEESSIQKEEVINNDELYCCPINIDNILQILPDEARKYNKISFSKLKKHQFIITDCFVSAKVGDTKFDCKITIRYQDVWAKLLGINFKERFLREIYKIERSNNDERLIITFWDGTIFILEK